jgi:hypothetical protein
MELLRRFGAWFARHFFPSEANSYRPNSLSRDVLAVAVTLTCVIEGFLVASLFIHTKPGSFTAAVIESAIISLTNEERVHYGDAVLRVDPILTLAAQAKANDMAARGYFSHVGPSGEQPWKWFTDAGYEYAYAGENLATKFYESSDVVTATETAVALEKINLRRQDVTARLISEAREQALLQKEYAILVLAGADWPKGVVGIAAGRLAGEFGKPTIVLELGEEYATGSARTYGAFDLVEALKATSSHLTKFGGHKEAAGLTLKSADLEAFKSAIIKYADEVRRASSDSDELILELDAELSANELSLDFFDILEQMAPFGAGNPKPQFWLKNASMLSCKAVGAEGRHVQIVFGVGGVEVQGIAFHHCIYRSVVFFWHHAFEFHRVFSLA